MNEGERGWRGYPDRVDLVGPELGRSKAWSIDQDAKKRESSLEARKEREELEYERAKELCALASHVTYLVIDKVSDLLELPSDGHRDHTDAEREKEHKLIELTRLLRDAILQRGFDIAGVGERAYRHVFEDPSWRDEGLKDEWHETERKEKGAKIIDISPRLIR